MLTVLCSAKGSPGVTTSALALAAGWPSDTPTMVVEADPAGGDLGIRVSTHGRALPATPTVATLAASARDTSADLVKVAVELNDQIRVVPGFLSPAQGRGMAGLWGPLAEGLQRADVDTLVDVGRFTADSPTSQLLDAADVVVLVMQPDQANLIHSRDLAAQLAVGRRGVLVPLIVTRDRDAAHDRADVDQVLAAAGLLVAPCVHLAWDPATVAEIQVGGSPAGRVLARSKLIRSAHVAADQLVEHRATGLIKEAF